MTDRLEERARELWEQSELRRLSSPWTTPTRFDDVREEFIARAAQEKESDNGK